MNGIRLTIFLGAFSLIFFGLLVAPRPAAAQSTGQTTDNAIQFTPEVSIPGFFEKDKPVKIGNNFIAAYIRAIYVYFIWVVGIVATVMIIFGGIKWVAAAGNPGQINDARETINNAIIGIIIALTSVVILRTINPDFVKLGLPTLSDVTRQTFSPALLFCSTGTKVECGKTQTLPNTVEDLKTHQPAVIGCLGIYCEGGDTVCAVQEASLTPAEQVTVKIQAATQSEYTFTKKFTSAGGCVKSLPTQPGQAPNDTLTVRYEQKETGVYGAVQQCGAIVDLGSQGRTVGSACPSESGKPECVAIGLPVTVSGSTVSHIGCQKGDASELTQS